MTCSRWQQHNLSAAIPAVTHSGFRSNSKVRMRTVHCGPLHFTAATNTSPVSICPAGSSRPIQYIGSVGRCAVRDTGRHSTRNSSCARHDTCCTAASRVCKNIHNKCRALQCREQHLQDVIHSSNSVSAVGESLVERRALLHSPAFE